MWILLSLWEMVLLLALYLQAPNHILQMEDPQTDLTIAQAMTFPSHQGAFHHYIYLW